MHTTMAQRASVPWTQCFKPHRFRDVCGNEETVKTLQRLAYKAHAMPHIILTGPVGSGKTTLAHCLLRNMKPTPSAVVHVHSYDDVQEQTFRDRMHFLVARLETLTKRKDAYALVVIENVDSMPNSLQMSVARLFEAPLLKQRIHFVFTCTKPHLLLPMITSRCLVLHLSALSPHAIRKLARRIAKEAKIPISQKAMQALRYVVSGDARLLVQSMETLYMLGDVPKIDTNTIMALFDVPPPHHLVHVFHFAMCNKTHRAWQYLQKHVLQQGYSVVDCYTAIRRLLLDPDGVVPFVADKSHLDALCQITEHDRLHLVKVLGRVHMRAVQGMASHIQLTGFLSAVANRLAKKEPCPNKEPT